MKILGIHWDVIRNEFQFDLSELIKYAESLPVTKRPYWTVISVHNQHEDPLPKSLHQKVNWDEGLEGEALTKWKSFINDLSAVKNIRVPRCCQLSSDEVYCALVSNSWVFGCFRKGLRCSRMPENRTQQW